MNPPPKAELLRLLREWIEKRLREKNEFVMFHELGLVTLMNSIPLDRQGKWPSAQWLMLCLAAVAGADCPIFHKGY